MSHPRSRAALSRWSGPLALLLVLHLAGCGTLDSDAPARSRADRLPLPDTTRDEISAVDLEAHVRALTDPRTSGRRAGSDGEAMAVDYLVRVFAAIPGLEPAGEGGTALHRFSFTSGVALGPDNTLRLIGADARETPLAIDTDWRPLAFSRSGEVPPSPVVFAGYGLVAPESAEYAAIDDYEALEVRDRWVLVFRDLPQSLDPKRRQVLQRYASLRHKAMIARDRGARGILIASGPLGRYREDLIPLRFDASLAGTRIAVVSIGDDLAARLLGPSGASLKTVQSGVDRELGDGTEPQADIDFERPGLLGELEVAGRIDLETQRSEGTNVLFRLQVGPTPSLQSVVLGAHFDHLGRGEGSGSLASGDEVGEIHPGADDNASGTALVLEIAELLAARKRAGLDLGRRDFVFVAWSGEELGLLGSNAWVGEHVNPHTREEGPVAYLNFDMVGRASESLVVQGLGSSPEWAEMLERAAASVDLEVVTQQDSYVPTDATSFFTQGVPVLNAFTGVHSEYHTPRDTPDRLDLDRTVEIGELFTGIAEELSRASSVLAYRAQQAPAAGQGRGGFRVFLGTIPDYAQTDVTGVRLTGVAQGGPAETGGLRGADIIVEVDGRTIENLYDYTYALEALRVGVTARIVVLRADQRVEFEVVPASRD